MKLRIFDNYLRLRLSQIEVNLFESAGEVFGQANIGGNILKYTFQESPKEDDLSAGFSNNEIKILVSSGLAQKWLKPEEVGIENKDQTQIKILVEKDFQCLHKRPNEDESDNFPNPLANQNT